MEAMQEVHDYLKNAQGGTYHLATVEGDQARVRPFGTVNIFKGKLYIQTGKVKDVYRQIIANPKVEIEVFNGETDWLRITATLVEDDSIEASTAILEHYPELQEIYTPGDGNCTTFYLKDATATFSSFVKEPRTVEF